VSDIEEGEICYATDQDRLYVKEGSALVSTQGVSLDVAQTFTAAQRGSVTTLTDGSTITPNFSASNNFTLTLAGTGRTLANPTNVTAGQSGIIAINQDGSGSRTITSYGSYFKFPSGATPTLSTGANDLDILSYYCVSSTVIVASLGTDFS
tara:strand:+ start:273 stop:725 length:453 start_codon:yes stop_codon:yes gene_type:complete